MRGIGYVVLIALPLLLCVGCDKDDELVRSDDNRVSFDVRVAGIAEQALTKGTLINDNSSSSIPYDTQKSFKLISWKGSERFYPATEGNPADIGYNTTNSKWQPADSPQWPASGSVTFFAAANLPASGASWTSGSSTSANLTYTVPQDASAQTDILMGCYTGTGNNGVASFTFYHPLTALVLKKGSFENATSNNVEFTKITVSGVYNKGTAVQNATDGAVFTWTAPVESPYTTTVQLQPSTGEYISVNSTSQVIGEPFLLIPQVLSSANVTISVRAKINGTDVQFAKTLKSGEWQAGKINTYVLGFSYGTGYSASGSNGQNGGPL